MFHRKSYVGAERVNAADRPDRDPLAHEATGRDRRRPRAVVALDLYADGHGQPTPARAANLAIGDLIRVDDDLDTWAVVEEEPVEDFEDPESLVIAWRDDQDASGQLIVAGEAKLLARRPMVVGCIRLGGSAI
jgi:hypothetical protein